MGIIETDGVRALTESLAGPYSNNMNAWLLIDTQLEFDPQFRTVVEIVHKPYLEPGRDFAYLEVIHPRTREALSLVSYSHFPRGWETSCIEVPLDEAGNLVFAFRTTSDDRVDEDGWLIDRLTIHQARIPRSVKPLVLTPDNFHLYAYPNPFNGSTRIHLHLPFDLKATMDISDLNGRCLNVLRDGHLQKGSHSYFINGQNWASGQYFLRFKSDRNNEIIRLILVK